MYSSLSRLVFFLVILRQRFLLYFYLRSCLYPWHRDSSPDTRTLSDGTCKTLKGDNQKQCNLTVQLLIRHVFIHGLGLS